MVTDQQTVLNGWKFKAKSSIGVIRERKGEKEENKV